MKGGYVVPKVALYKQDGSQVGEFELNESVFGIEPNKNVLNQAIIMQQASLRQGTHAVKNRTLVRGGGRKPWRQKGTGQARQGSIRAPHWVGGGVVFGPTPRKYGYKLPKKMRQLALKSALSSKVKAGELIVLEDLSFEQPKTRAFVEMLAALNIDRKSLFVIAEKDENIMKSANNLQNVKVITRDHLNVLDIVKHDKLVLTKEVAEQVGGVLV